MKRYLTMGNDILRAFYRIISYFSSFTDNSERFHRDYDNGRHQEKKRIQSFEVLDEK